MGAFLDFLVALAALTRFLFNPTLFAVFEPNFRHLAEKFVLEEIFCRRPQRPQPCCPSYAGLKKEDEHPNRGQKGVVALLTSVSLRTKEVEAAVKRFEEDKEAMRLQTPKLFYPLRPLVKAKSCRRHGEFTEDFTREKHWGEKKLLKRQNYHANSISIVIAGEILEKSYASLQRQPRTEPNQRSLDRHFLNGAKQTSRFCYYENC